ncbi:formate transporter, partial [Burkholderia multivorans]
MPHTRPRYYLHAPIIGALASQARHDSRPQSQ